MDSNGAFVATLVMNFDAVAHFDSNDSQDENKDSAPNPASNGAHISDTQLRIGCFCLAQSVTLSTKFSVFLFQVSRTSVATFLLVL